MNFRRLLFVLAITSTACAPTTPLGPTPREVAPAAPAIVLDSTLSAGQAWDLVLAHDSLSVLVIVDGIIRSREEMLRIPAANVESFELVTGTCCAGPCKPRPIPMFTTVVGRR